MKVVAGEVDFRKLCVTYLNPGFVGIRIQGGANLQALMSRRLAE